MNRNTELHFSNTPQIDIKRSKFERSHNHKTTFNNGDIIPIYVDSDILPGDTVQLDQASIVRMATPLYPIMDNLYMDVYFFFVPHRLVWEHWQEFWGENENPWIQETNYTIPQLTAPSNTGWEEGSLADYMGIPTKVGNLPVSALPFRAYVKCWNDFFRDQNLKSAAHMYKDDSTRTGKNKALSNYNYITDAELGAAPLKAAKFHDYFTSALPAPQKGPQVNMPLASGPLAVLTQSGTDTVPNKGAAAAGIRFRPVISSGTFASGDVYTGMIQGAGAGTLGSPAKASKSGTIQSTNYEVYPTNLYVDLSQATAASINNLRTAFAIQKYYENAGLHGTRYIEYIRSVFGVTSSDARFQRAEYLGGKRIPINIDQVLQTSETTQDSPLGHVAAYSRTIDNTSLFTKSFEEHGTLLGLAVIRAEHTYQQGLERMWSRKTWLDFYNPFFAHLGEQSIIKKEIYANGWRPADDTTVFGYQEAWAEYRYKPSRVSGYMRSNATGTLDAWHFADKYETAPTLSSQWIDEPYENVDRTIAVTSELTHQFIADFYFKTFYTRPMPVYSVPGLIDHV